MALRMAKALRRKARREKEMAAEMSQLSGAHRKQGLASTIGSTLGAGVATLFTGGAAAPALVAALAGLGSYVGSHAGRGYAKQHVKGARYGGKYFKGEAEALREQLEQKAQVGAFKTLGTSLFGGTIGTKLKLGKGGITAEGRLPKGGIGGTIKKAFKGGKKAEGLVPYKDNIWGKIGKAMDIKGSVAGGVIDKMKYTSLLKDKGFIDPDLQKGKGLFRKPRVAMDRRKIGQYIDKMSESDPIGKARGTIDYSGMTESELYKLGIDPTSNYLPGVGETTSTMRGPYSETYLGPGTNKPLAIDLKAELNQPGTPIWKANMEKLNATGEPLSAGEIAQLKSQEFYNKSFFGPGESGTGQVYSRDQLTDPQSKYPAKGNMWDKVRDFIDVSDVRETRELESQIGAARIQNRAAILREKAAETPPVNITPREVRGGPPLDVGPDKLEYIPRGPSIPTGESRVSGSGGAYAMKEYMTPAGEIIKDPTGEGASAWDAYGGFKDWESYPVQTPDLVGGLGGGSPLPYNVQASDYDYSSIQAKKSREMLEGLKYADLFGYKFKRSFKNRR